MSEASGIVGIGVVGTMIVGLSESGIQPTSIDSEEEFGSPDLRFALLPPGLDSEEAFGTSVLALELLASAVLSEEAFGLHLVATPLFVQGIDSEERFGILTLTVGEFIVEFSIDWILTGLQIDFAMASALAPVGFSAHKQPSLEFIILKKSLELTKAIAPPPEPNLLDELLDRLRERRDQ